MTTDTSLRGRLRSFFHLPSTLTKTKFRILAAEKAAPDRIGTWKCTCGHPNAIYHLPSSPHPIGLLQCRACSLSWHPSIAPKITTLNLLLHFSLVQPNTSDTARVLPPPQNACTTYGYICLGYSCGLTWRTEIKTEWLSGKKRQVLALDGKRAKLHCDCGMKIFEAGMYVVFEIVPRSSVSATGDFAAGTNNHAQVRRAGSAPGAAFLTRNDSGMGRRMSVH
jgi:hypothetical protein